MLLELADRAEAATGPDAELDCRIRAAIERDKFPDAAAFRMGGTWGAGALKRKGRGWRAFGLHFEMRRYTASLDAARTLAPEGCEFGVGSRDATNAAWAWCGSAHEKSEIANAATPELALTAACLRARASLTGEKA